MRNLTFVVLVTLIHGALAPRSGGASAPEAPISPPSQVAPFGSANDFDFLFGRWRIENRRLEGRLVGSTEWRSFEAESDCRPLSGGIGNVDQFSTDFWPGFVGLTLRFFDPASERWSLYWVDNRTGVLQPPVVGAFAGDVGIFEGEDELGGRPIRVRFTWSRTDREHPRWEQAFSGDGGKSWETNWEMRLSRIPE